MVRGVRDRMVALRRPLLGVAWRGPHARPGLRGGHRPWRLARPVLLAPAAGCRARRSAGILLFPADSALRTACGCHGAGRSSLLPHPPYALPSFPRLVVHWLVGYL